MIDVHKAYFRTKARGILNILKNKQYDPYYFETIGEANKCILDQLSVEETVGVGGSVTLREDMGLVGDIRRKGITVIDHWDADGFPERRLKLKRKHRQVDIFLSGVNAFTENGLLVNLDGGGNRVASLCSGPKKVIVVVSSNKLVENLELAIHRVRNKAAVLNAIRINGGQPCVEAGKCVDCNMNERICAALLILMKKPKDIDRFSVVLVNENMGY